MLNTLLLKQRGLRLVDGRKTFQDLCDFQWILCPGERASTPPAIYLEGELDKVTGVESQTTLAHEMRRVQGGMREHAPTKAYRLRNAHLYSGYVYKESMKLPLTTAREALFSQAKAEYIPEAALACTLTSNRYFGHWITDGLTMTLAAQELATAVTTKQHLGIHQADYSDLFDIRATPVVNARFDQLIVIEDFGQNSYKRDRYEQMRARLKQVAAVEAKPGVMLLRGKSGTHRPLQNEPEIADFLASQGFTIINPETTPVRAIVEQTLGAQIVVGVEGSQLTHGLFTMASGGVLLALQPPSRFNNVFKDYTDCLGLNYGFVVGEQAEDGFKIDLSILAKTLDKANLCLV